MTGAVVPGGAPAPAAPPRPGLRARLSSLQGHDTLCLPVGEIRDLVAALDAARAEVERLRGLWPKNGFGEDMNVHQLVANHRAWTKRAWEAQSAAEAERDALRADVERLRARTHEIQAQEMAKRAALDSELAEWRTRYEAAKEWTEEVGLTAEHAAGEWKYSPFWGLTSYNARSALLLLRRAATHLDELAKGATPGPWRTAMVEGIFYVASAKHGPVTMDNDGPVCACIADDGGVAIERDEAEGGRADAEWMATMSPVVAAPLAEWLRGTAEYVAAVQCSPPAGAVALARALLGETETRDDC